jgi:hypothetical protein
MLHDGASHILFWGRQSLPKHAVRSVGRLAFRLGDVPRLGPGGGLRGGGRAGGWGLTFWG